MEQKKNRGGKREGAGRKRDPIRKTKMYIRVPEKYAEEIKVKIDTLTQAYFEKCEKEL